MTLRFPGSTRPSFALGSLLVAFSAVTWSACNDEPSLFAIDEENGVGGYLTTGNSGAGGSVIEDTEGDGGAAPSKLGALCGDGCSPDLEKSEPCTLGDGTDGACHLVATKGSAEGECTPAGALLDGAPCLAPEDCAAGFGCVAPGVCRAYCCGDPEACPDQTFCAARPMVAPALDAEDAPPIPACVTVEPCVLLDDDACTTKGDTCTIVRTDGTTSCTPPGEGKDNEACPCAAGYVCAFAADRCMRLCRTKHPEDCPSGQHCSGGNAPYPAGVGVCVEL